MNTKNSFFKHMDFLIIDIVSFIISFILACVIKINNEPYINKNVYVCIILCMILLVIIYSILYNPYKNIIRRPFIDEFKTSIVFIVFSFIFITILLWALKYGELFSRLVLAYTYVFYFVISIALREIYKNYLIKKRKKEYKDEIKNIVLICNENNAPEIIYNIKNAEIREYVINALCFVNKNDFKEYDNYIVLNKNEVYDYVVNNKIDSVCIFANTNCLNKRTIENIIKEGVNVETYVSILYDVDSESKELGKIGPYDVIKQNSYSFTESQKVYFVFKRMFDIVISVIGLLFFIILFCLIKIISVINGDYNPIMYSHIRVGKDGKEFKLYKFRSMVPNADELLKEILKDKDIKAEWQKNRKIENDPRITKIGNFLRKTSLDEFPQFINVFKGDMSIIGPRPLIPGELKEKNGFSLYEKVKPGITGWWACNGRSSISYEDRLDLEYYYIKNCSLYLDMLCIIKTIIIVFTRKGAK